MQQNNKCTHTHRQRHTQMGILHARDWSNIKCMWTGKRVRWTKLKKKKIGRFYTIHSCSQRTHTLHIWGMAYTRNTCCNRASVWALMWVSVSECVHMYFMYVSRALHHIFFFQWPWWYDFVYVVTHCSLLLLVLSIVLPRCMSIRNFVFSSCWTVCQNQWTITKKQNVRRILCVFFHQKNV